MFGLSLGLMALGLWSTAAAAGEVPLEQLSWIEGRWQGSLGRSVIEEHWTAPSGDTMMGMFRMVRDGEAVFLEFMTIQAEPEGTYLLLRHFDPGLIAREEKGSPMRFNLIRLAGREAVFERDDPQNPTRLVFRRPSDEELTITLEKTREGKPTAQAFSYRRLSP